MRENGYIDKLNWRMRYWKKSYFKYFLKYLKGYLMILIPCIFVLFFTWKINREQVLDSGQIRFQEGVKKISSEISKMRILGNDIENSLYFQNLARLQDEITREEYIQLKYARDILNDIRRIYDFSPFYFVLFRNNDLFISNYQVEDAFSEWQYGSLMNASAEGSKLDAEGFRKVVLEDTNTIYSFTRMDQFSYFTTRQENIENAILCVVNKVHILESEKDYRLCYVIHPKTLVDLLLTDESKKSGFARITDQAGNIILDYGNADVIEGDNNSIVDLGNYWMLSAEDFEETGWNIQIGIPKKVISEHMNLLYRIICGYIVLGILLVLALSVYYGKQQYKELEVFYSLIPKQIGEASNDTVEFEKLDKILRNLAENSEIFMKQKEALEEQKQAIRIENLIMSGVGTKEEQEELEKAGIINSEFYCVAVVRMFVKKAEQYSMALLILQECLKSYSEKFFYSHVKVSDELFVFSLASQREAGVNDLKKIFEEAANTLSVEMEVSMGVGISAIGTEMSNLKRCCDQAYQVLEAYYQPEVNAVKCYWMEMNNFRDIIVDPKFLDFVDSCIICGKSEELRNAFRRVSFYYEKHPIQFEIQREQYFYSVKNVLHNNMLRLNQDIDVNKRLPVYGKEDSAKQMTEKLLAVAEWLIAERGDRKENEKENLQKSIFLFLEQRFADKNMSVNLACRELQISKGYLQEVIKEKTGDTFAVYVEKLRIDYASTLLRTTDYSNEQIADKSGFVAVSTFYRVFSKRMGVSPGKFRE